MKILEGNLGVGLDQLNQTEPGAHYILIYDHLITFRQIYSYYTKIQLEENNELVYYFHITKLLILLGVVYEKMRVPGWI